MHIRVQLAESGTYPICMDSFESNARLVRGFWLLNKMSTKNGCTYAVHNIHPARIESEAQLLECER